MTGPQGRVAGVSFVDFFYFLAATVSPFHQRWFCDGSLPAANRPYLLVW